MKDLNTVGDGLRLLAARRMEIDQQTASSLRSMEELLERTSGMPDIDIVQAFRRKIADNKRFIKRNCEKIHADIDALERKIQSITIKE